MIAAQSLPPPTRSRPLPYRTIIAACVGLMLPLAVVAFVLWSMHGSPVAEKLSAEQKRRELQATEDRELTTYDWIEKPGKGKGGVVRLPVQRARELFLKEASALKKGTKP